MRPRRRSFTLFELVVVLALLVVVAAIAVPALDVMYSDLRVKAGVDALRASWAQARARAMNEGRPYRFAVVPNEGKYRIAPLNDSAWTGSSDSSAPQSSSVTDDLLPKGINFRLADGYQGAGTDADGYTTVVIFLPDGTARDDAEITLNARDARPIVLKIRGLTGAVTVVQSEPEKGRP